MEIVFQTIRIIDYENNVVYVRDTPETFSDYVRTLITYINDNSSIRAGSYTHLDVYKRQPLYQSL